MKAIVYTSYGSPENLSVQAWQKPTPQAGEVLIRVKATALNYADGASLRGKPLMIRPMIGGLLKPTRLVLGADIAGEVTAVGENVTEFKVGDAVFGDISSSSWGGLAEFACAPASVLVKKPANISYEEAAAVPMAGVTAFHGLHGKYQVQAGQSVLINGASGGVGSFALQIAKALGAEVTAVCSSSKVDLVRSLGADHVIDYTQVDFVKQNKRYDFVLAANGNRPISDYTSVLTPTGTYVCTGGSLKQIFQSMLLRSFLSKNGGQTIDNVASAPDKEALTSLKTMLEQGQINPVIDKCYSLADTAVAFRHLLEGHAKGKIVISQNGRFGSPQEQTDASNHL